MALVIILILAIPIYFLFRLILKKWNLGNDQNRKYIALVPTVILSPLVYLGLIYIWLLSVSYYPTNDFDRQKWESNPEERYKMSENIIDSKMLIGKTKQEIIELLGNDYYTYSESHISYNLGFVPGLIRIDPDVLDIYFENGIVIKVNQHRT